MSQGQPVQEIWAHGLSEDTWTAALSLVTSSPSVRRWDVLAAILEQDKSFKNHRETTSARIGKNEPLAERYREAGNRDFTTKRFAEATSNYSKGVLYSSAHSKSLALCLANRSAALFHLKHYQAAARDAEAGSVVSPGPTRDPLCPFKQQAALKLDHPHPDKLRDRISRCRTGKYDANTTSVAREGQARAANVEGTGGAFETIDVGGPKGRGLYATRDLQPGETVYNEAPIAHVVTAKSICGHCLGGIEIPYACPTCVEEEYCSPDHAEAASSAATHEKCVATHALSPQARLAMITAIQATDVIENMVAHDHGSELGALPDDYLCECALAAAAADVIAGVPAERVFNALLRIRCNGVAMVNARGDRIGLGLYKDTSMLNHNCSGGNAMLSFEGSLVRLLATRDVLACQELLICYGPQRGRHTREERASILQSQYAFECHCESCEEDMGSESLRLVCPNAAPIYEVNTPPRIPTSDPQFSNSKCGHTPLSGYSAKCDTCGKTPDKFQVEKSLAVADAAWQRGESTLADGNTQQALKYLKSCLRARLQVMHSTNKAVGAVCDRIAECYALSNDFNTAAGWCQASTDVSRIVYGDASIEHARELHKLAQLHFNAMNRVAALGGIRNAMHHLIPYQAVAECGEMISELQEMLRYLQ